MISIAPGALPILLLDDDRDVLDILQHELSPLSATEIFYDPRQALEAIKGRDFSVIISDLTMPNMNGLEFLAHCADLRPATPRILLTGHADLADLFTSINGAKLSGLLAKPWQPGDLKALVQGALKVSQIQHENEELRRIALTDALTGVANHRYFWERLESEFSRARRYGRSLSLVMSDIDDFKKYNDTYGHPRGDAILRDVAQGLEKNRRSMDSVARYGGEEFAMILPEVSHAQALEIARRHLQSLLQSTGISMSFGVATFPEQASSSTELVHTADQALLKAKQSGKGRVTSASELSKK